MIPCVHSRSKSGGFTLIELIIVIFIIGLISAIAYPQYKILSRANLRETSMKLAGTIRYLYARAIMDKKYWRLAIDLDQNQIWSERLDKSPDGAGLTFIPTTTRGMKKIILPKGVEFRDVEVSGRNLRTNGIEYINFSPYGGVDKASIHLKHHEEEWVFTLATKPFTGRVAIFDHDVDVDLTPIEGLPQNESEEK